MGTAAGCGRGVRGAWTVVYGRAADSAVSRVSIQWQEPPLSLTVAPEADCALPPQMEIARLLFPIALAPTVVDCRDAVIVTR
jgi:hypothetical protein